MNNLYKTEIKRVSNFTNKLCDVKKLHDAKILIAGSSGMIGKVLVDILMTLNEDYSLNIAIAALGRSESNLKSAFGDYLECKNFSIISHDVNVPFPDYGNFDYIIHAASNTHPVAYSSDPIGTITANVIGTQNLLEYARCHSTKRFVFLSSVEIYGEAVNSESFQECDLGYIDCNTTRAGYPESKRVGESLCCAYSQKYDIDYVIPRVCRVYGPTMKTDDSKALSQFIKKAVAGENIVLKSDGSQFYSYINVMDAATAILKILMDGKRGEAYNIASKKSDITLKSLSEKLAGIAETRVVFEFPSEIEKNGFSKATCAILDNSKLLGLGWKELYDIDEGIRMTFNIMREV